MKISHLNERPPVLFTIISLWALLLFTARTSFAQTNSQPAPANTQQAINKPEDQGDDFDNDVDEGKAEVQKDAEAQKLQKEVVDGEDEQAGDEEDNDIQEDSDLQQAENNEGVSEADRDNNDSEIDEVDDADNLDEQSQEVINEHEAEEEIEIQNEEQQEKQEEINKEKESSPAGDERPDNQAPTSPDNSE